MQTPTQLVELVAAWERRWSLGRRGPGCGPADVLGRVLPRARPGSCRGTVVVPGKDLAGGLVGFLGNDLANGSSSSGSHPILRIYDLYKDLHATMEVPLEPWF